MASAYRCDGCRKTVFDEKNEDDLEDWSFLGDWMKLDTYDTDGEKNAYYWLCSWDCLAKLMLDKHDIAPELKSF